MFATVQGEIADRHLSSQRTVALIRSLEEPPQVPLASACKGLAFVQLYVRRPQFSWTRINPDYS